jgi:branched-chain amino acid aminotransferase
MSELIYIDGVFVPKEQATIPLYDHGYLYGDGVFEGVRVYENRVFELVPHVERLIFSAHALGFALGTLTVESVCEAILETCRQNNHQNGYIRVNLSRGTGLGLDPSHIDTTPRLVIATRQLALYPAALYESCLTMITCATRVPSPDAIDPRIKCTGKYINNIMAKMEANRVGAGEGIMLNQQGLVAEATGDNVFIQNRDGVFVTPHPSAGCLKGITRNIAIELLRAKNHTVVEENISLYDIYTAKECFLTGTAAEIIPAVTLDQREIGTGKPGDNTRYLIDAFRAHTKTTGVSL